MPSIPAVIRHTIRAAAAVSPALAARLVERLWFTPPRTALSEAAKATLASGQRLELKVAGRSMQAWRFGDGPPVALMHGWGGRAAQLLSFIEPLRAVGHSVVLFDALGHGNSDASPTGSKQATFFDFADGLTALASLEPLHALVAHSGAAVATAIAMRRGLQVGRLALLAPMTRPERYARPFSESLGLSEELHRRWQSLALARINAQWSSIDVTTLPVTHSTPQTLVVHDPADREVPYDDGVAIAHAWPSTQLVTITGLGHRRLLSDAHVVQTVTRFVAQGHRTTAAA